LNAKISSFIFFFFSQFFYFSQFLFECDLWRGANSLNRRRGFVRPNRDELKSALWSVIQNFKKAFQVKILRNVDFSFNEINSFRFRKEEREREREKRKEKKRKEEKNTY